MRTFRDVRALILSLLVFVAPASASDIRVDFVAVVDGVNDVLCQCMPPDAITPGDTVLGHYYFDSEAVDTDPGPNEGLYRHTTAPYGIVVEHPNYVWETNPASVNFRITVTNDAVTGFGFEDRYWPQSYSNSPDPFISGQSLSFIILQLFDSTAQVLTDDCLPPALDLDHWSTAGWQVWGSGAEWSVWGTVISLTVEPTGATVPTRPEFALRAYPNPFASAVTVGFILDRPSTVTLDVYDVTGRRVRTLLNGRFSVVGEQQVSWDGRNDEGVRVVSGVYYCALRSAGFREVKRIVLLR